MKQKLLRTLPVIAAFMLFAGGAYALNEHDLATLLGISSGETEALDYKGTIKMDSAYVGDQDVGGVTFFNGTVINVTTDEDGNDIPVTFGDDVRIDGEIFRTARNDGNAVKIDDDLEVDGDVTANNLYTTGDLYTKTESDDHFLDTSEAFTQTASDSRFVSQDTPTWDAQTYFFSAPPSLFTPEYNTSTFTNKILLYMDSGERARGPIMLPHGAVVTGYTIDAFDNSAGTLITAIYRLSEGVPIQMASLDSTGNQAGNRTFVDDLTSFTIDNENNSYYFVVVWSDAAGGADFALTEARLEYTWTGPGASAASTGVPSDSGIPVSGIEELSVE